MLSVAVPLIHFLNFCASDVFPSKGSMFRQLASLRRLPLDSGSPISLVLSSCCDFPLSVPLSQISPRRRYPMSCDFRFEKVARLHRIALVTRSDPGVHGERWDLSSVRETSIARSHLLLSTPVGPPLQTIQSGRCCSSEHVSWKLRQLTTISRLNKRLFGD